ncbi:MAG TPA: hypothetical protein VI168_05530 [Croceibacterium sp.]
MILCPRPAQPLRTWRGKNSGVRGSHMGVGEILSETFGIVKGRFGPLLGLWAIYFAITVVLFIGFGMAIGTAGIGTLATMASGDSLNGSASFAAVGGMAVVILLFYLGYLLVAMAQYASTILLASPLRQVTVGEALGAGLRAGPALLLLLIVLMVGYFGGALVLSLLGAAFSALGSWGTGLFALILIPLVIWIGCRLAPLFAVISVDGMRNPFKVIARSWRLTRGYALSIFLSSLVFIVILVVICGIALLPSIGMLRTLADPAGLADPSAAAPAVGGVLLFVLGVVVAGVLFNLAYCAFSAVIHAKLTGAAGEGAAEAFA